jgi:hypothetical protein
LAVDLPASTAAQDNSAQSRGQPGSYEHGADLHRYVTELSEFKDDPKKSTEGKLEAIQMAWHDEVLDRTQG